MSSPVTAPEAPKKEFSWKRLFINAAGFGAGFALTFVLCAWGIYLYESRPRPLKPWNTNAVIADFDYTSVEGDKNTIVFVYTLQNNTDFDYKISNADSVSLGAKLEEENSVS